MRLLSLLGRGLWFHRLANFAVLLGVAIGTSVLAGALIVGDSLRGSLRQKFESQIGPYSHALVTHRFFREQSAPTSDGSTAVQPAILMRGSAEIMQAGSLHRASGVNILGTGMKPTGAAINPALAKALNAKVGDPLTIRVRKLSEIPRESLLGRRTSDDATGEFTIPISEILPAGDPASAFQLAPGVAEPLNAYIALPTLQQKIDQPGRVNALLATTGNGSKLAADLAQKLTLDDWGLVVQSPAYRAQRLLERLDTNQDGKLNSNELRARLAESDVRLMDTNGDRLLTKDEIEAYYVRRGIIDIESRQMLLEPAMERAARKTAEELGLRVASTLVYLANEISDSQGSIPYSVIACLDASQSPPLGLFLPPGNPEPLRDDEIVLADWPASPLKAEAGQTITLKFFEPEQEGRIRERSESFRLRGRIPLTGPAADPDLAPEFPGITDKLTLAEWDPPFPYDNQKVQKRDEEYWERYRTTPKAYLSLAAGDRLFASRFGSVTSLRLAVPMGADANALAREFASKLLAKLDPVAGGFVFEDLRARLAAASQGGQDFGLLFLGFSFFLIAAALMLIALLTRLNLERRASEVGLLLASGFRPKTVRGLLLGEGLAIAALGALLGLLGAVSYASLMLKLLAALWPDGSIGSFLKLHVTPRSLAIGYFAALLVSALAILWAIRGLARLAPSALLRGVTSSEPAFDAQPRRYGWRIGLALALAFVSLLSGLFLHGAEERAGAFFGGGALALTAALIAVYAWLKQPTTQTIQPGAPHAIARLGIRNAGRNPGRSLLTTALLAAATFLLVAVESFRRSPEADFLSKSGGSGGFSLLAQSDLPLFQDPGSPEGRQDWLDALERTYQRQPGTAAATIKSRLADAGKTLDATTIAPIRVHAGDDVSCLNLYQPGRPRLVGVPRSMIARGGFSFAGVEGKTAEPWALLETPRADGEIPVFGEANTVMWMLKSGLGGTLTVNDGNGQPVKLRIVGLLKDSVFQGELLMADSQFRTLFPREEGYSMLLVDGPPEVRELLETAYGGRGLSAKPARDLLQSYLAVENTYLSTFQVLGGLGLVLGALGLAVVLMRGIWERRGELALMRCLGFRRSKLERMVFSENLALLALGLGAGIGAALLAIAPQLWTGAGSIPLARLIGLLAFVIVVGLTTSWLAMRRTLDAPLVPALRKE